MENNKPEIFYISKLDLENIDGGCDLGNSVRVGVYKYPHVSAIGLLASLVRKFEYDNLQSELQASQAKYKQAMTDWSADAIKKTEVIVGLEKRVKELKNYIEHVLIPTNKTTVYRISEPQNEFFRTSFKEENERRLELKAQLAKCEEALIQAKIIVDLYGAERVSEQINRALKGSDGK